MIRLDDKHLLMIEPDKEGEPSKQPLEDDLTAKMDALFKCCERSTYLYKGMHFTRCERTSDNADWILPNGVITHSLATYYVRHYRPYIPQEEIEKIERYYEQFVEGSGVK